MVAGVEHVAIAAKDPRALTEWYCEVLGLRVLADNGKERPTCLVGGTMGAIVEIMPDNGSAVTAHQPYDPGFRHIALKVDDMAAACAALEGKVLGLMPPGPAMGGGQIAFFNDPEGNLLQLVERPKDLL
jgi:glyoxylase I family protein